MCVFHTKLHGLNDYIRILKNIMFENHYNINGVLNGNILDNCGNTGKKIAFGSTQLFLYLQTAKQLIYSSAWRLPIHTHYLYIREKACYWRYINTVMGIELKLCACTTFCSVRNEAVHIYCLLFSEE